MIVTRKSQISGKVHTREIPISEEQYWEGICSGLHIQDAFPQLSADDREFLLTGITPEEWDAAFGGDDE